MARTKTKKFRGSMTHGKGKKAGRGAGLRGGRGNAGLLKHRFMYMLKNMPDHFGRHGFKRPQSIIKEDCIINIGQLEERFPDKKEINLTKEGYDKLLGTGEVTTKMIITVNSASEKAIEKIKEKGGEVKLPKVEETPSKEPSEPTLKEKIEEQPKEEPSKSLEAEKPKTEEKKDPSQSSKSTKEEKPEPSSEKTDEEVKTTDKKK